jgi:predicted phage terminase large subunit-like protein
LDPKEIESAKKSMYSFAFRQEFMASFEAKDSELFKESWLKWSEEEPKVGDYYIACDLAGFEDLGDKHVKTNRLDESAFAVVKVNEDGWYVKTIEHGRWDLKETARRIFNLVETYQPVAIGFEKGIAQQAVMSPLNDLMKQQRRFFRIDMMTHGNKKKTDRIVWALQGRMEHGRITLNPQGDYVPKFLDQLFQFPSKLTHDDLLDALAYVDQLAQIAYPTGLVDPDEWEPSDIMVGY